MYKYYIFKPATSFKVHLNVEQPFKWCIIGNLGKLFGHKGQTEPKLDMMLTVMRVLHVVAFNYLCVLFQKFYGCLWHIEGMKVYA